jgi:hypothetical protein
MSKKKSIGMQYFYIYNIYLMMITFIINDEG